MAESFQGVSDAELAVLKELWRRGEGSPTELRQRLEEDGLDWAYTTVQTLLHRLLQKGWVRRRRDGVAQRYDAAMSQDELVVRHLDELAERVGEAGASSLVHSLVRGKKLSRREIARLRRLLDEAEEGR